VARSQFEALKSVVDQTPRLCAGCQEKMRLNLALDLALGATCQTDVVLAAFLPRSLTQ
jgi:hypothetical protein